MTVRVAINGFGRIGRSFLRATSTANSEIEVVAINDLVSIETNAHLLRYDSSQGRFPGTVEVDSRGIVVNGRAIAVFAERDPRDLPWKDLAIDVVVESTGRFTKRDQAGMHIEAGARRVVVSAPADGADATFVVGVNDQSFDPASHFVVSNASCTTNCFVPMVKVLDDAFEVRHGLMTTVHAYTNDQELLDLARDNMRRARAAAVNIVPTETGAARATSLVMESMKGRLDGRSLRVPVQVGSITDFTAIVGTPVSVAQINEAFATASKAGPLSSVLEYTSDPIVSSDIVGNPSSCIFDSELTMALALPDGTTLVKVFGWYDNEWGFSNRLADLIAIIGRP